LKPAEERTAEEKKRGGHRNPLRAWSRSGSKESKRAVADGRLVTDGSHGGMKDSLVRAQHEVHGPLHKKAHRGRPIGTK
jgi:hypothetical protein